MFHRMGLRFRPDKIIYRDGSRKEVPQIGLSLAHESIGHTSMHT